MNDQRWTDPFGWRPMYGIVAVGIGAVMFTPLAIVLMLHDPLGSETFFDAIGYGLIMFLLWSPLIVPVVVTFSSAVFGLIYLVLRVRRALRPTLFPLIAGAPTALLMVIALAMADSWSWYDVVLMAYPPGALALLGYLFARVAMPRSP